MYAFRYLLVGCLIFVGCSDDDPSTNLQPQPNQRDMARSGGVPVDMYVSQEVDMNATQGDVSVNETDQGTLPRVPDFGGSFSLKLCTIPIP